jgi:signal transduction histidine kinase/DNA-binding response OmpR family regulator
MPAPRIIRHFLITWGFRIGIGAFAVVGVMSFVSLNSTVHTNKWLQRTQEVLAQLTQIQLLVENAESSHYGYVISNKTIFNQAFETALARAPGEINKLLDLVSDNPTQVSNALELRKLIDLRFDRMKNMIRLHLENAAAQQIADAADVETMSAMRTRIAKMEAVEDNLQNTRLANSERQTQHTKILLIFGGIMALALLYANRLLQQRHAEHEWRRANLMNMIIKSVGDGLVVVDEKQNVTHYNPAAERMLGNRHRDIVYYDPKTRRPLPPAETPLNRALRGETTDDVEVVLNGVVMSVNTRPLVGSDNRIVGAAALFRDYTRQKAMEKTLESEKERALQASRLKSEALASMSHEIRTPMNGVVGMVTLLLDTALNATQKSYAMTIKSSAESLLSLINGILDHAKIEAGKLTLDNFDFHLPTLADDVMEMFRYQARSKRLELSCEVTKDAQEWFHGDANRIRQVMVNLVGNAFKFTESGRIAIKVNAVSRGGLERELRIEVSDTGIGISQDNQTKLFQKFSQVHEDKTKYGGTGLGLLLCKQFVILMGGQIGIDSIPGKGSIFWFTVKVAPGMRQQKTRDHQMPAPNLQGHVLVVEDQPVNRQVVKSYLEKFGVTCDIHHDGREGLDAFMARPSHFDLVLMDVQMPVMDGFQCAREIRKLEETKGLPRIPIIALTAEGRSHDRENCLNAGMDDFLSKPIDLIQFTDTLKKWLRPKMNKAEPEEALVNWTVLNKLAELKSDGRPLDMALVEEFLRTSMTLVEDLEDALRSDNKMQIREVAHAVKSPARTVGLVVLGDLCESIEEGMCDASTSRRLTDVHTRSVMELRNYLRRRSNQAA